MLEKISFLWAILFAIQIMGQSNKIASTLEVYNLGSGKRDTILTELSHFEAPNWSRDGKYLLINQQGSLYEIMLESREKRLLNTGSLKNCNNDHGISFDGRHLAISNNDVIEDNDSATSRIYLLPSDGGSNAKLITPKFPSYWHGWSPDGKSVLYTAKRDGDYNIFSISIAGGDEKQLSFDLGLDDGPEYSPDGKYIYYNSMKSGKMELWRMDSNGNNKIQLTNDQYSNWFPHPSPKNDVLVYISYLEDQGASHPPMKNVALKLYDISSGEIKTLYTFTGGQGSINVPSWSPDGKSFAFVSYRYN